MTYVGKILVIVIMAFALVFLGVSTVVFTTATNWKAATEAQKKKVSELQTKNNDATAGLEAAKKDLEAARTQHAAAKKALEGRIAGLEEDVKRARDEITDINGKLGTAQQNAKMALDEAGARKEETDVLREQKSAVEKQANEFKIHESELNDRIRILERSLETATRNAKDLRDRVARYTSLLQSKGFSADISAVQPGDTPPTVQGEVARVDRDNRRVEITIGTDDGVKPNHELYLYRMRPRPEYLGKIRIISADPDQAVGRVIDKTINGKKIQEGDIVSSTLRPQS